MWYFTKKKRWKIDLGFILKRFFQDSFYDADVVNIRENRLTIMMSSQSTLPRDSWLQFDEKNQEIYGLPMNNDVGLTTYMVVGF